MTRLVAGLVAGFSIAVVAFNLVHLKDFGAFAFIPISLSPFALVGALLIAKVPCNAVGWLLSGAGVCFAIAFAGGERPSTDRSARFTILIGGLAFFVFLARVAGPEPVAVVAVLILLPLMTLWFGWLALSALRSERSDLALARGSRR